MPIYAYRCGQCGHEVEALQKLNDPALTDCPSCGRPSLAKKLTAAGFQLKGSGWYQTDFRSGSTPAAKPDAGGDAAKGDAKTDSKPETASTTAGPAPAAGCGSGCACH